MLGLWYQIKVAPTEIKLIETTQILKNWKIIETMKNKFKSTLANQFSEPTLVSKYLVVYKLLDPSLPGLVLGAACAWQLAG